MTITAPGPCRHCRLGCPFIAGPCSTGGVPPELDWTGDGDGDALERELLDALSRPLNPNDQAAGCFPGPRIVSPCPTRAATFADEVDALYPGGLPSPRLSTGERLVALALVGPWLAAATGAIAVAAAAEVLRSVRRG